ncbi:MAG: nitroreductase family protein [Cyanobacteria bacterium J06648_1]
MRNFSDQRSTSSFVATQHQSESNLNLRKALEDEFPLDGTKTEQLKFLLNYAVLAPSSHNTQPWQFSIVNDAIDLYADRTRALPSADPNNRELIISCGAALFHLRIAIRHFGYSDLVEILPEQNQPSLLARIRLGSKRVVRLEENFLFRAIGRRYTNRLSFEDCQLPKSLQSELETACCSEGNYLQIATQIIPETIRQEVVNLIVAGDRLQMSDPSFRQELSQWIHSSNSHDGITAQAQGLSRRLDPLAPLIAFAVRSFDLGESQADKDYRLAIAAPVLMSIFSNGDTAEDWIATGEALAHLLLRARVDNVWASFFNQPIQVPQLRSRLQALFPNNGYPQIILRLGYAKETGATPRRSVEEVLNEVDA